MFFGKEKWLLQKFYFWTSEKKWRTGTKMLYVREFSKQMVGTDFTGSSFAVFTRNVVENDFFFVIYNLRYK